MPTDESQRRQRKHQGRRGVLSRLKARAVQAVAFGTCCIVTSIVLGRVTDDAHWPRLQYGVLFDASLNDIVGRLLGLMGLIVLLGTPVWFVFARRAAELAGDSQ